MYLGRNKPKRILEFTQLFEWNVLFPRSLLGYFSGLPSNFCSNITLPVRPSLTILLKIATCLPHPLPLATLSAEPLHSIAQQVQ